MKPPIFSQSRNFWESLQARFAGDGQRLKFIQTYQFPEGLKTKFARLHSSLDLSQRELVFDALRDYFLFCHQSRNTMISMPSQIVDEAWHEFILFTHDYSDFCLKAFGRYLHHTPAEAMQSKYNAQNSIKRVWQFACMRELIDPKAPDRLPLLFAIDGMLGIPNGLIYSLDSLANEPGVYNANNIRCAATPVRRQANSYGNNTGSVWSGDLGSHYSGHTDGTSNGADCGSDSSGGSDCGSSCSGSSCGGSSCGGSSCGGGCGGGGG